MRVFSSKSKPSVFGALGPDDAYFSNRVQVAARDAQQRWPLLGEVAPEAPSALSKLDADVEERWAPGPAQARESRSAPIKRPALGNQLADGLERLAARSAPAATQPARKTSEVASPAVSQAEDPPPAARQTSSQRRTRPSAPALDPVSSAPASAARKTPVQPRSDSLRDVFQRIAPGTPAPEMGSPETRKSLLGRLGRR